MANDLTRYEAHVQDFFGRLPSDGFDYSPCLFCPPITESVQLFIKGTMAVRRCKCGFVWNARQPNQQVLTDFYTASRAMESWAEIKDSKKEDERQRIKFTPAAKYLAARGIRSALDIGCGNGVFLSLLQDLAPQVDVLGTDLSSAAISACRSRGIPCAQWGLEQSLDRNPITYDAVSIWGVLEHVKNPLGLLRSIHARLSPGGLAVVCVPNVESLVVSANWSKCFTFCPQHLWYFSHETLARALDQAGLEPVFLETIEPEVLPTVKAMSGLEPYGDAPEWAYQDLRDGLKEREILDDGRGYKIVAIAQSGPRVAA